MSEPRRATGPETIELNRGLSDKTPIPWADYANGDWWLVHSVSPSTSREDLTRAFNRIKIGSRRWARQNGKSRNLRRRQGGRQIWVRFDTESEGVVSAR